MRLIHIAFLGWLLHSPSVGAQPVLPAATDGGLFSSYDVFEMILEAPFDELFSKSDTQPTYSVRAKLTFVDAKVGRATLDDVSLSVRGHSSRRDTECEFPKLKLKFQPGSILDQSPFRGMTAVKIGTHCGERADDDLTARYGRWASEKAAHREALVYRLLEALNVPSLKARPARITYSFTDRQPASQPLVRNALFVEDDNEAMKRFGAQKQITEKEFSSARTMFSPADTARLALAEALIGNFDWCLRMFPGDQFRCNRRHPLWNVLALQRDQERTVPVLYDFDLAGMVVGRHTWFKDVLNGAFAASEPEIEVIAQTQRTRTLFSRQELDQVRRSFIARKAAAYDVLTQSTLDDAGRHVAKLYMDSFFAGVEDDVAFYRPVVVHDARIFVDAERAQPACGAAGDIPVGTPVKTVETSGEMSRVLVLDALWHYGRRRCDAILTGAVWITTSAIGTDVPP